ncbi:prohead core scaffold protein [Synechococcus phage S-CRM01]|uniref:head scaffolding protein n=1 Tax=Synechococcus phage S-CRM01 TaxID=1026955 RepID=UPI000209E355|nr:head scaffolding protein [Synechococcus phage S-CRM01]AEC52990.1 prohead core scaffold protein [Synechococcus phage S-CRM01]
MATSQSKTQVNARAASGDPMPKLSGNVVPGTSNSYEDLGGPTNTDYKADNDSAKLNLRLPSQSKTVINDKGGPHQSTGGGTSKKELKQGGEQDYAGSEDGTKSGRTNPGPEKLGRQASYEHTEIDETAGEQLDELADSANASEDFKERAKVIFEAALNQKLQLEVARLEEEFSTRFEEEIGVIAEQVEAFLNYTSAQWLEENRLVVENGIRNKLSESFMGGLRSLFEDHYVTLPDEKYDIFESMVAKLDEMEDKLNEQIDVNVTLNSQMSRFQRESILADVSWDLSEVGKERLAGLAENVEFESEESYRRKLGILKESFIESSSGASGEYLEEETEILQQTENDNSPMAIYAKALSRSVR